MTVTGVSPLNHRLFPPHDAEDFCFHVGRAASDEVMPPAMARQVPEFEGVCGAGVGAGHCVLDTLDHTALRGIHLDTPNRYFANWLSGDWIQQVHGVCRKIAELVLHGAYQTLDLAPLSVTWLAERGPLLERNIT